jgi:hypothetical protein
VAVCGTGNICLIMRFSRRTDQRPHTTLRFSVPRPRTARVRGGTGTVDSGSVHRAVGGSASVPYALQAEAWGSRRDPRGWGLRRTLIARSDHRLALGQCQGLHDSRIALEVLNVKHILRAADPRR